VVGEDGCDTARWCAFADEALWVPPAGSGCYVFAAALIEQAAFDPIRAALTGLLLPRQRRLHWRDESVPRKRKIAAVIAEADVRHLVVVGAPMDPARQERARRKVLQHLLYRAADAGVEQVVLEARTPLLNARDRAVIEALRGQRVVPGNLRVSLVRAADEPLLWLPDAVAGCVRAGLAGTDADVAPALAGRARRHHIVL
jgi:hypothetical protein